MNDKICTKAAQGDRPQAISTNEPSALSPRRQSHYTIAEKFHSCVAIALTHPHHFVLRNTICDSIDTAVYIWRVIDVR
ncbi:MAG: hypothetical protein WBA89_30220 [Microcoleus sp.]|uniref:hypothetical protein n=1 Tax=Microcoleus sp. TaxID=44472 RepID=UPI003C795D6E